MQDLGKAVTETVERLGISRATVYNLLQKGELQRAPRNKQGGKGRPITRITTGSIVNYINNH